MKKQLVTIFVVILLIVPMFTILLPKATAQDISPATNQTGVVTGVYTNPIPTGCGFINFEEGVDSQVIRSTLPGLRFTTTLGYDWVYLDVRTGSYNARSLTDPTVNHGDYVVNGYFAAWLGPNMGQGRIDFVNGTAGYISVLACTYSGLEMDAYDSNNNLIGTSGWAYGNYESFTFSRLTIQVPNMAYVLIHDTGNYWEIDDLVTDAGGYTGLGPGPVSTCIQVSANPSSVLESPAQTSNITATVTDQIGNPWKNVTVTFNTSNGGVLSGSTNRTNNDGQAFVTFTPNVVTTNPITVNVSATVNGVSSNCTITLIPPTTPTSPINWKADPNFQVQETSISFQQYLVPTMEKCNALGVLNSAIDTLNRLPPVNIYVLNQSSVATQQKFTQDLQYYFNITPATSNYNPTLVYILELPCEKMLNAILSANATSQFNVNLPIPFPANYIFDNTTLQSTPTGSLDFALTFSKYSGISVNQAIDSLSILGGSVMNLNKALVSKSAPSIIATAISATALYVESIGDADLSMITSDLNTNGQLNSYSVIDLKTALDRISTISGITEKILETVGDGLETLGYAATAPTGIGLVLAAWKAGCTVVSVFDLSLEVANLIPQLNFVTDSWVYHVLALGVSWADTWDDPEGTITVPTVYDSQGNLILGYNSTSGDVTYANANGMLISCDGVWLSFLYENTTQNSNYTIGLSAIGGNASVPYVLHILSSNQTISPTGYVGMLQGGTNCTIPVNVTSSTLPQQTYLNATVSNPVVSLNANGSTTYNFIAKGLLTNGSAAAINSSFLIINGSQYEMAQYNSSTFQLQKTITIPTNLLTVQYVVYMVAPNVPGGFASGYLTQQYNITFNQAGVGSDFTGTMLTIDQTSYPANNLPATFLWDKNSTHTFSYVGTLSVSSQKQYVWSSTTGLSTSQTGTLNVTSSGTINGNYNTQTQSSGSSSSSSSSSSTTSTSTPTPTPTVTPTPPTSTPTQPPPTSTSTPQPESSTFSLPLPVIIGIAVAIGVIIIVVALVALRKKPA